MRNRFTIKQRIVAIAFLVVLLVGGTLFGFGIFSSEPVTIPQTETESGTNSESELNPETDSVADSEPDSDLETEENTLQENEDESETESETETEDEAETEAKKPLSYLEQWELNYVEKPVARTREECLEKIKELSQYFPILRHVYENEEKFTNSLIAALAGNPEMADFAYGHLFREPIVTGGFTEEELAQDYPLFLQWDIRWGYMPYGKNGTNLGSSGCGPSCLSMAVHYLTGATDCTPDAVARYSLENGHYVEGVGTAWALLLEYPTEYGLDSRYIGKSESILKKELDKGNIIICSVRPGNFTAGGHFIVIYGYDKDGFKVNDPKCIYRSRLSWPYSDIKSDIKQTWSIGWP